MGPLNMTSTKIGLCAEGRPTVQGYRKGKPTPPWTFGALEAAGGLRSTADDLITFARSCIDPPAEAVGDALRLASQTFHRSRLPSGNKGLGWMLRSIPSRPPLRPGTTVGPTGHRVSLRSMRYSPGQLWHSAMLDPAHSAARWPGVGSVRRPGELKPSHGRTPGYGAATASISNRPLVGVLSSVSTPR